MVFMDIMMQIKVMHYDQELSAANRDIIFVISELAGRCALTVNSADPLAIESKNI